MLSCICIFCCILGNISLIRILLEDEISEVGGWVQPGNRFVSFVRASERARRGEAAWAREADVFPIAGFVFAISAQEKYSCFVKMWWFSVKLHFLEILHCIFFKCKAFSMFRICFDILQPYSSYFLQKDQKKHETFLFSISIGRLYRFAFGCLTKRVLDIETGAMGSGRNGGHGLSAPWARRNGGHGLWAQRGLSAPRANCKLRKPIAK